MPKLVIGMKNNRGFTLIEILVVLLIIGITLGFAMLAFGDFGGNRRIIVAAEQFVNYVKFIQQDAILETGTLGIKLDQNGYQVMRFIPLKNWQPMLKKGVFHQQRFPSNALVHLENNSQMDGPQIIINAAGDMSAFSLNFGSKKQANIARVIGGRDGSVALQLFTSP